MKIASPNITLSLDSTNYYLQDLEYVTFLHFSFSIFNMGIIIRPSSWSFYENKLIFKIVDFNE